ncbi:MAG: peptide chain release factor 2 [Myxococcaceae bacterium]|nr:peptide chain release factor 2 [Myxococcaceae bacterium]MBH2005746.1 peptide chain release factor 2 [Myxococcaceae bacterium]
MEIDNLKIKLDSLEKASQIPSKQDRIRALENEMEAPHFWSDQKNAAIVQKEKATLEKEVARFLNAKQSLDDCAELLELATGNDDELRELEAELERVKRSIHRLQIEHMLGGPSDRNNAILSVNVGQGGVDSQDFTEMLLRMYTRYAERRGYTVELMDIMPAEEAGLKNATILVSGEYAYGYLKAEIGVHRLVRISPFDSNARRHTSFSSVWVIPEIDDSFEVDIKVEDLRVDTYRAGGAGGQHVNKTDSAVRITHLPTNTVVACQSERSQTKNRSTAMKLLRSKLYDLEMKKRLAEKDKAEAVKMEASFGSQIRNYVLAPYQLAKDLRTNLEVGNVNAVLDGDIQSFIESVLIEGVKVPQ